MDPVVGGTGTNLQPSRHLLDDQFAWSGMGIGRLKGVAMRAQPAVQRLRSPPTAMQGQGHSAHGSAAAAAAMVRRPWALGSGDVPCRLLHGANGRAAHPWCLGFDEGAGVAQVDGSPAAPILASVVTGATPSALATAIRLGAVEANAVDRSSPRSERPPRPPAGRAAGPAIDLNLRTPAQGKCRRPDIRPDLPPPVLRPE